MRVIQFEIPGSGRRVGVIDGQTVRDLTSVRPGMTRVYQAFAAARYADQPLDTLLAKLAAASGVATLPYDQLLEAAPGEGKPFLHPPLDYENPHRVLITGTGLTHTGSMQSRDQMHAKAKADKTSSEPQSDSAKMFQMGLEGGRPPAGQRGTAPEWFYKGNGSNLRGHHAPLEIPAFALDGGEEPELVGCYIIDDDGVPRRLGFTLSNEWSDHATEKINYLYLAPSKLRVCSMGPELVTDSDFQEITLRCTVHRGSKQLYDSGELKSGEKFMCHSLANLEDHHFKYPQHRIPGDVHLHFFGTSKLSFGTRDWKFSPGDEIRINAPGFSASLCNTVSAGDPTAGEPIRVKRA